MYDIIMFLAQVTENFVMNTINGTEHKVFNNNRLIVIYMMHQTIIGPKARALSMALRIDVSFEGPSQNPPNDV